MCAIGGRSVFYKEYIEVARLILEYGGGKYVVNGAHVLGGTFCTKISPIEYAICNHNIPLVELLMENGARPSSTLFQFLRSKYGSKVVELALDAGSFNINDAFLDRGFYALAYVCSIPFHYIESPERAVKLLLRKGADIDRVCRGNDDDDGDEPRTALCFAIENHYYDVIKLLLKAEASLAPPLSRFPPLWYAIQVCDIRCVKILVHAGGADVNLPLENSEQGVSLLHFAIYSLFHPFDDDRVDTSAYPGYDEDEDEDLDEEEKKEKEKEKEDKVLIAYYSNPHMTPVDEATAIIDFLVDARADLTHVEAWRDSATFHGFYDHSIWERVLQNIGVFAGAPILK